MTIAAFFDIALLATLPGRTTPKKATLELCDRLSNPLIEVDAAVHKTCPDVACDLGHGIAPGTVIDEGAVPLPDYHVLWPGKPTMNTVCDWHILHTGRAYAR